MMKHLGAHHDIDTVVREWKTKRVGTNGEVDRAFAGGCELGGSIEPDCRQINAMAPCFLSRPAGDVTEPRAHIK
jgi:hypothetical protein